jgi:hypothetical protein
MFWFLTKRVPAAEDAAGAARPASGVAGKRMESNPKAWSARTHGFATHEHG